MRCLQSVEAIELNTGEIKNFTAEDCQFGYRTSIFKQSAKDQYIITCVCLRLSTVPKINIEYPSLKACIENPKPSPEDVFRQCVEFAEKGYLTLLKYPMLVASLRTL